MINGCSGLVVEVLGERGGRARAVMGMVPLPNGPAKEIQMVVEET